MPGRFAIQCPGCNAVSVDLSPTEFNEQHDEDCEPSVALVLYE